jgi:hypothetical protein
VKELFGTHGMNSKTIRIFFVLMVIPVFSAWSYIDGGTGMLLIQGLLALIGGIVFFVKNPINAIKSWIARFRK